MLKLIGLLAILAMCCHARYNPHTSMPLAPVTPVIGFFPAGLPAVTQLPTRQPITPVTRRSEFCTPSFNVSHPTPYYNFYMQAADPTIRLKRKSRLNSEIATAKTSAPVLGSQSRSRGQICDSGSRVKFEEGPAPYTHYANDSGSEPLKAGAKSRLRSHWLYNFLKKHGLGYDKNKAHCMIY
ncbi:unnamed protein product [Bursaphelenchus xylophilus]|uniref:(pine wood nematode) hypothetical protein n=1 Tax=Bursaphelenchus xylophilus TaxID=6326 RepID=A0A7I8XDD6_BURXY|nr:unnamed protein product [Bursaphelenchus xylophilus]CAG9114004.1 unnamed protein product [Bursaphelenchus xylophilus]